jgi:hypothetical protein
MRNQSPTLGGCPESTSGDGGCHLEIGSLEKTKEEKEVSGENKGGRTVSVVV